MNTKLFSTLASVVDARLRCEQKNNLEWFHNHTARITELCKDMMPSGSGFDCGTKLDFDNSTGDKLVFLTSFHHMNDSGMYDGWTEHSIIVTPSLIHGFNLKITGRDRNDIKEYIAETFGIALNEETPAQQSLSR
jgi:hypothetical protein